MDNLTAIKNYILFLKEKHNLSVSIHPRNFNNTPIFNEFVPFNIHENSYCAFIKTNPAAFKHCIDSQKKVCERSENGSFCGVCHAGVFEYVYPINSDGKSLGFISVSGYKTENSLSFIKRISKKYGLNFKELESNYNTLKDCNFDKTFIDTLITPLCAMLELEYLKSAETPKAECGFAVQVENYIKQYRHSNITSRDICEHFSCSRSYMSTEFNKHTGKTIREYINILRLNDAKALLAHSDLNVTEIAYSVGFTDANYFSVLFKKQYGISPMQYKKSV